MIKTLRLAALLAMVAIATSGCATIKEYLGITPTATVAQAQESEGINAQLTKVVDYVSRPRCDKIVSPVPCAETARIDPLRRAAMALVDATDDYEAALRAPGATAAALKLKKDTQAARQRDLAELLKQAGV